MPRSPLLCAALAAPVGVLVAVLLGACGSSHQDTFTNTVKPGPSSILTASTPTQTQTLTRTDTDTDTLPDNVGTVPEPDSSGAGVELITSTLQANLEQLGYKPGSTDGQFAAQTQVALRDFQNSQQFDPVERGALGPSTTTVLIERLGKAPGGGSAAVQALQSALTEVGLFHGTINGEYDQATLTAVRALQTKSGIDSDGFYGSDTAKALTELYLKRQPEPAKDAGSTPPEQSLDSPALLKLGSTGAAVTRLQQRLIELGYRPGPADGTFGVATGSAVLAFQKRDSLARDSVVGPSVDAALKHPTGSGPPSGPTPRIDVDIARQVIFVVLKHRKVITLNTSTGNGETYGVPGGGTDVAVTPVGHFTVIRKIPGDHQAPLGTLRNPLFFYRGWAIHGAANVPAYPASHGCARISNADADWLYPQIPTGTPVIVYDTTGKSPSVAHLSGPAAPGY